MIGFLLSIPQLPPKNLRLTHLNLGLHFIDQVKVSKFQKQNTKFSHNPKKSKKYLPNSAVASNFIDWDCKYSGVTHSQPIWCPGNHDCVTDPNTGACPPKNPQGQRAGKVQIF